MVEVVSFWWREERKMISTVWDRCGYESQREPHDGCCDVWSSDQWSHDWWNHVTEYMFDWMCIDGRYSDRGGPLVVHLMYVTVEDWPVQQSKTIINIRSYTIS